MEVSNLDDLGMEVSNLDHLGLVAGIIDDLGLESLTNAEIGKHPLEQVSAGQVVKAMLLNCLGFLSAPLYLFSEFFESKPVSHLLGAGVEARHLNDDRLGRVLDQLYEQGTTEFFLKVAQSAVERFGISLAQVHLDSSSFSVSGEYAPDNTAANPTAASSAVALATAEQPAVIEIRRGYSRDHRPDLKQFVMNLVCSADGGIPLWLKVANGNQSDGSEFGRVMCEFASNWQMDGLFVIDAAFYNASNLEQVNSIHWLSRVPQTLSAAQALIQVDESTLTPVESDLEDYRMWEVEQTYAEIPQRWILIESQTRKANAALWQPELNKLEKRLNQTLNKLQNQVFACQPDAMDALRRFQDSLEIHQLTDVSLKPIHTKRPPGRPAASSQQTVDGYRIQATLERQPTTEEYFCQKRSRFILATNLFDKHQWTPQKLLQEYKAQQKVERGFRFLKDPIFFTSSVFVKKPQRVEALALIMALTLMVYALAERKLRLALDQNHESVLDQRKQPTNKPTFRWIIQKFQGIHLLISGHVQKITNLTLERLKIIRLFGPSALKYYASS